MLGHSVRSLLNQGLLHTRVWRRNKSVFSRFFSFFLQFLLFAGDFKTRAKPGTHQTPVETLSDAEQKKASAKTSAQKSHDSAEQNWRSCREKLYDKVLQGDPRQSWSDNDMPFLPSSAQGMMSTITAPVPSRRFGRDLLELVIDIELVLLGAPYLGQPCMLFQKWFRQTTCNGVWGRGCDEAEISEEKRLFAESQGFGKEFYRKGSSVKRFWPFSESLDFNN